MSNRFNKFVVYGCMLFVENLVCVLNVPKSNIILVPIGVLLVVYIPGDLILDAFFPKDRLQSFERAAVVLAMSAAVILTVPYIMSSVRIPFTRANLVMAMDVVVSCLMIYSFFKYRRNKQTLLILNYKPNIVVIALCTTLFIVVGLITSHNIGNFQPAFYCTNSNGQLTNYPFQVIQGKQFIAQLHLENPTNRGVHGVVTERLSSGKVVFQSNVTVSPHDAWMHAIVIPSEGEPREESLTFEFTSAGNSSLTRHLKMLYSIVPNH